MKFICRAYCSGQTRLLLSSSDTHLQYFISIFNHTYSTRIQTLLPKKYQHSLQSTICMSMLFITFCKPLCASFVLECYFLTYPAVFLACNFSASSKFRDYHQTLSLTSSCFNLLGLCQTLEYISTAARVFLSSSR